MDQDKCKSRGWAQASENICSGLKWTYSAVIFIFVWQKQNNWSLLLNIGSTIITVLPCSWCGRQLLPWPAVWHSERTRAKTPHAAQCCRPQTHITHNIPITNFYHCISRSEWCASSHSVLQVHSTASLDESSHAGAVPHRGGSVQGRLLTREQVCPLTRHRWYTKNTACACTQYITQRSFQLNRKVCVFSVIVSCYKWVQYSPKFKTVTVSSLPLIICLTCFRVLN